MSTFYGQFRRRQLMFGEKQQHLLFPPATHVTSITGNVKRASLRPTAGKFVEHLFIQRLARFLRSHRAKYVSSYKLVHYLAVSTRAVECHIVIFKLNHHFLHLKIRKSDTKFVKASDANDITRKQVVSTI